LSYSNTEAELTAASGGADNGIMGTSRPQATILVVDDDEAIRTLAAQALQGRGYQVLVAGDGPEALQIAAAHPSAIHLLVTDIMLPSENGIALARAILSKRRETRVLYMSGFQTEMIQLVQDDGGPDGGFLQKPFTPRMLLERVEAIVPAHQTGHFPEPDPSPSPSPAPAAEPTLGSTQDSDAVYRLETPVKCPQCGESISTLKAVRLLRTQVNFTSTLPRRGRVAACPRCLAIVPVELTNF
jgi:DNA-binding response OmpR family regulator